MIRKRPTKRRLPTQSKPPWTKTRASKAMNPPACSRASRKKPRGQELSPADKFLNHIIAGVRIEVEHAIAGIKRCRIVKDVLRLTKDGISDLLMEIACGLHNLRMSCRHPLPDFDLRTLSHPT